MFVLLFIVTGAAAALVAYQNSRLRAAKPALAGQTLNAASVLAARDSDGDGLRDWEEALYQSDPQKIDSDGDGTPDGEEVRKSRDPAKAGPNDPLNPEAANDAIADSAAEDDDNLTFSVAQQLLESGVLSSIGADGGIADTEFLDNLALPAELDPALILNRAATITIKDLTVSPTNDAAAVRNYFNNVYAVYAKYLVPLPKDDLTILNEIMEKEDYTKLAELDAIILALERSASEIKKIPAPSGYETFAVTELNHIKKTARAIQVIARLREDPIAALAMLRERTKLFDEIARSRTETKALLASRNVVFPASEGGYQLFQ
ncbi:MAG: hypothetical protein HY474_00865 [Candidatus Sungbacteria bacterium]|uniref:Calcium-binding protein n=1 Tax=Candidatus Sungiibacteriota bacterium TaxID=2750080 RepID=A0A932YW58_9BACT|nr:hypothetical protein [Candidatus Sungbacteria bacterium]